MRKYKSNGELETVICNCCGKKLVVKDGIMREGALNVEHAWDYFRKRTEKSIGLIYVRNVMMNY